MSGSVYARDYRPRRKTDHGSRLDPDLPGRPRQAEPRDANRTMVITGDHSAVLNAYVEILKAAAGSRLIGLLHTVAHTPTKSFRR